ncbi:MAG: hypothetical protein DRR19_02385 [Candidatus Parabeggiatoa sp. nov. 1]|nr:MAG: hypothetical protein DRR19_02385 [Gammaproteobacteria bacterium]
MFLQLSHSGLTEVIRIFSGPHALLLVVWYPYKLMVALIFGEQANLRHAYPLASLNANGTHDSQVVTLAILTSPRWGFKTRGNAPGT